MWFFLTGVIFSLLCDEFVFITCDPSAVQNKPRTWLPMASRRGQILLAVFCSMRVLPMRLATVSTQGPLQLRDFALCEKNEKAFQKKTKNQHARTMMMCWSSSATKTSTGVEISCSYATVAWLVQHLKKETRYSKLSRTAYLKFTFYLTHFDVII